MEKLFADKEYCHRELIRARTIFGNRNTSLEDYGNLIKALAFMYIHCPEEIAPLVLATINETNQRLIYLFG